MAVPSPTAVTTPVFETVITLSSALLHVTAASVAFCGVTVAVKETVSPTLIGADKLDGVNAIFSTAT